jgi:hypothetical protein
MLLFLHGVGERGPADGSNLLHAAAHESLKVAEHVHGSAPMLGQPELPFVVANPQLLPR